MQILRAAFEGAASVMQEMNGKEVEGRFLGVKMDSYA